MTTSTEWMTSNGDYGLSHYHAGMNKNKAEQISAGLSRAERAYHEQGHCYPRFERQKIRALLDENILSGAKQPDPYMLQRIPNVPRVDPEERPNSRSSSQRSYAGSQRSQRSVRSEGAGSQRSAASRRAASGILSSRAGAPSAALIRTATYGRPSHFGKEHYQTFNALYGGGPPPPTVSEEIGRGRETWMLGRGGGQITTFNNCLNKDGVTYVPLIRCEPQER